MTQTVSSERPSSKASTDAELIALIAAGDVDSIGALYDRHIATLYPVAQRILRDRSEAEDVLHDAFVLVSQRAHLYSTARGSVIAWLTTMVRNLTIDHLRRRDRRGALARQVFVSEPEAPAGPEQQMMTGGDRASVQRALAALPTTQRSTLYVAFYEGLTYAEIAEREGVPVGTVKSRAARAIAALRDALALAS